LAGQHPTRRQILEALAVGVTASTASGFCRWNWAFAEPADQHHSMHMEPATASKSKPYQPAFFSPHEYATVEVVAELILPRTGGAQPALKAEDAGATDAGVAEFIDFLVSKDPRLQSGFKTGLQWLDHASGGQVFVALTPADQTRLLERIAYRKNFRDEDKPGQDFFQLMRKYTVYGFYTSRIGLESIDYPGLRFYAESPSVPQDAFLKSLGV
jgi:gluconate 2-dehydrogenase gamma chain